VSRRISYIGFEFLTAVTMKCSIFWDISPWNPVKDNQQFGGTLVLSCDTSMLTGLKYFTKIYDRFVFLSENFEILPNFLQTETGAMYTNLPEKYDTYYISSIKTLKTEFLLNHI
jgi:hypothetical protein